MECKWQELSSYMEELLAIIIKKKNYIIINFLNHLDL